MVYRIGDKTIKCKTRIEALEEYKKQTDMVINELESRNITFQIAQIDELNFKASLFHLGNKEGLIEDSVVFDIKVVMKNKI